MSTTNAPNQPPQQQQGSLPASSNSWYRRMLPSAKRVGFLLLFYLIRPVIFSAKARQANAAGPMWQAEQRWAQVNGGAFLSLLWYVPILLFHGPLASFWSALFITFAHWFHVPLLAALGGTTILPPLPSSTLLRWVLFSPLAGLLAMGLEMIQPRTVWKTKRIIADEEQQELDTIAAAEEKKRLAQEQRKLKATQQAQTPSSPADPADPSSPSPPKKPRKLRTPAKSKEETPPVLPPASSLWGQIDWRTVPNTHPLKQAVREEAERLEAQRREDDRNRWLAQQRAAQQREPHIVDSRIIDSTSTPALPAGPSSTPTPADAAASSADDGYNWDEGDGSIQE